MPSAKLLDITIRNEPRFIVRACVRYRPRFFRGPATLAVARKLVAYLLAIDPGQPKFQVVSASSCIAA
jgi:hypothetical protein